MLHLIFMKIIKNFKIKNLKCFNDYSKINLSIDVNDDLKKFENFVEKFKGKVDDLSLKKVIESYKIRWKKTC